MNLLSVKNLSKYYGERLLFGGVTFGLDRGDRLGLIANNGAGKSTLMRILMGEEIPDSGEYVFREGTSYRLLAQEPRFAPGITVGDLIRDSGTAVNQVIRRYEAALAEHAADNSSRSRQRLEEAAQAMDHVNGWDFERRVKEILTRFGIHLPEQDASTLSGGQQKRLALALVLIDQPDILLLDEPTNHLDLEMIEWLEKYLSTAGITLLLITHDRYFLDNVCNQILEIANEQLYIHRGNYAYFLEKRAMREEIYRAETERAKKLARQELEWMRRMPKARTHKSKSRIEAFYTTSKRASEIRKEEEVRIDAGMSRIGKKTAELRNLSKAFNDRVVIRDFSYIFQPGERLGIIGPNGSGKSTLLKILTGNLKADKGEVILGETVVTGYYAQEGIRFREDQRVIDVMKEIAEFVTMGDGRSISVSQFLQFFLFPPPVQYSLVSSLSGGERRRLYLLTVLMKNPNFLILDEPTNDLDLSTLNRLEDYLESFRGVLIIVSHDRYLLDRLTDHLFIFSDGEIEDYYGTYTEYRLKLEEEQKEARQERSRVEKESESGPVKGIPEGKKKLSYKEKSEYEALEGEIARMEVRRKELEDRLNSGQADYREMETLAADLKDLLEKIDTDTLRWLELDERNR
ncbi:MAG: ABC-F family ATP-binding cassette domain-containing protein [Bacteroidota bacterium]